MFGKPVTISSNIATSGEEYIASQTENLIYQVTGEQNIITSVISNMIGNGFVNGVRLEIEGVGRPGINSYVDYDVDIHNNSGIIDEKVEDAIKQSDVRTKAEILAENKRNGKAFEKQEFDKFKAKYSNAVEQVTIKVESGVKTRVDAIGLDSDGKVVIHEFKSSPTAPLTYNQEIAFPEIKEKGGVIVGKGKGNIFKKGYYISPGTEVKIIRPE